MSQIGFGSKANFAADAHADVAGLRESSKTFSADDESACVITDPADQRIRDFVGISRGKTFAGGVVVAEGAETLRQVSSSDFQIRALFVQPVFLEELRPALESRARKRTAGASWLGPAEVFVADIAMMETITGISHGRQEDLAFATVDCKHTPSSLADVSPAIADTSKPVRLLALDGLTEGANVGHCIRVAAAFGIDGVLCSSSCCDPFNPRAVRASLGRVFLVPVIRGDLPSLLQEARRAGVVTSAAVVQDGARFLDEIDIGSLPPRWGVIVGSEHSGVSQPVREAADMLLKVRMAPGVDSLNVVVSAGVLLHGCAEREGAAPMQQQRRPEVADAQTTAPENACCIL